MFGLKRLLCINTSFETTKISQKNISGKSQAKKKVNFLKKVRIRKINLIKLLRKITKRKQPLMDQRRV